MANPPKNKGTKGENQVVKILNGSRLFQAVRQPGSGIYSAYPDDVYESEVFGGTLEVKFRKSVPATVYKWLGMTPVGERGVKHKENRPRAVFMKRDWFPWLVTMTAEDFVELCQKISNDAASEKNSSAS